MRLPQTLDEYVDLLTLLGVRTPTAIKWSAVFMDTIHEYTFSKGPSEFARFLPQILHESAKLEHLIENLDYREARIRQLAQASPVGSRWRSLLPRAAQLAHNPRALANALYCNRYGNGSEESDDGWNFRGRSPLQITFRGNYAELGEIMGQDLTVLPGLLEQPHYALEGCILHWEHRVPDNILGDDLKERLKINGGRFGLKETTELADATERILGALA